jgi:hypothetical protein
MKVCYRGEEDTSIAYYRIDISPQPLISFWVTEEMRTEEKVEN